jgi:gliding motility-associated lipoprotein GldH
MIRIVSILIAGLAMYLLVSCDSSRVYEDFKEFNSKAWYISDTASFDFQIADTTRRYNLKFNIRNNLDYPYARLFVNYNLSGPDKNNLSGKMISGFLFDQKTGKPFGNSGLGDIYDNQFPLLDNFKFSKKGTYSMRFHQFMRMDTLPGILAAGLRVELVEEPKK